MKKYSLLLSGLFLAGLFFTSCSSEKNMIIEKRHYGNGFYIHQSGNKHDETVSKNNSDKTAAENVAANTFVSSNDNTTPINKVVAAKNESAIVTAPVVSKHNSSTIQKPVQEISSVQINNVAVEKNVFENHTGKINTKEKAPRNAGGGDVPAIVLVLLCLFLPPVAVLLNEGSINNKFWIDLVLCLLFFLPGIIYAFYVCFA